LQKFGYKSLASCCSPQGFELEHLHPICVGLHEDTIYDIATRLLASTAANDPDKTEFPLGCEVIIAVYFSVVKHHWNR